MKLPISIRPRGADGCDVAVFGENSVDFVVVRSGIAPSEAKETLRGFDVLPGGQAATAAVAASRLGATVRYIGVVGSDDRAAVVRNSLTREGLELVLLEHAGVATRIAVVLVDAATGERTVLEYRDAGLSIAPAAIPVAALTGARILLVDATDVRAATALARVARAAGIATMVDVDRISEETPALLAQVDVIVVPAGFLSAFTGSQDLGVSLRRLHDAFNPAAVVVTLGAEGSLAYCQGTELRTPAFRADIVDTTGAGDAFRGGFLAAWAVSGPGADLEQLLLWANATAALNCRQVGAQAALPRWPEVDRLITDRRFEPVQGRIIGP